MNDYYKLMNDDYNLCPQTESKVRAISVIHYTANAIYNRNITVRNKAIGESTFCPTMPVSHFCPC